MGEMQGGATPSRTQEPSQDLGQDNNGIQNRQSNTDTPSRTEAGPINVRYYFRRLEQKDCDAVREVNETRIVHVESGAYRSVSDELHEEAAILTPSLDIDETGLGGEGCVSGDTRDVLFGTESGHGGDTFVENEVVFEEN
ncbi:hypothetical protein NX059_002049 [Plenodomus lindquistii]|nr:hypothetical protein NX059_002049 [Plenodomus lindquistii]